MNSLQDVLCQPIAGKATLTRTANSRATPPTSSTTPASLGATRKRDFWKRYGISRWTFRDMQKRGEAPDTFFIGSIEFISHEAEARWLKEREAAAAAQASRRVHRLER